MVRTNQRELVSIVVTADGRRVAVPFRPRDQEPSPLAAARRLLAHLLALVTRSRSEGARDDAR